MSIVSPLGKAMSSLSCGEGNSEKVKIFVIELEPTHYKIDLWNIFSCIDEAKIIVFYTECRNWASDAGHNYRIFPEEQYESLVYDGKGFWGKVRSGFKALRMIRQINPDLIYIAGYVHIQTIVAIIYASFFRVKFVVHADVFNIGMPNGNFGLLKWVVRESLRWLIFIKAQAVLVCGKLGVETAQKAGCFEHKIYNFPYVINLERIITDKPKVLPNECKQDLHKSKKIIFFSGRMIPRKGLITLLEAMTLVNQKEDYVLWIEGDGPDFTTYLEHARNLLRSDQYRFLGFCQYDLHSWLMRSADIVVVPSLEDSWGIVVDEAMQLGKVVISSDMTGSGYALINHGVNGYIFPAGDAYELARIIGLLISDKSLMAKIGESANICLNNVRPIDNAKSLMKIANVNNE